MYVLSNKVYFQKSSRSRVQLLTANVIQQGIFRHIQCSDHLSILADIFEFERVFFHRLTGVEHLRFLVKIIRETFKQLRHAFVERAAWENKANSVETNCHTRLLHSEAMKARFKPIGIVLPRAWYKPQREAITNGGIARTDCTEHDKSKSGTHQTQSKKNRMVEKPFH